MCQYHVSVGHQSHLEFEVSEMHMKEQKEIITTNYSQQVESS